MRLYNFRSRCSEVGAGAARWEQLQRGGSRCCEVAARFGQKQQILKYFFLKNAFSEQVQRGAGAARFRAGAARFSEQVQFFGRVARCSEVGAGAARSKKKKI